LVAISYDGLDTVYIIGGNSYPSPDSREILKYSLSQDTLDLVGELPEGLILAFAGNDGQGTHYVVGGANSAASTEIYRFQEGEEGSVKMVGSLPSNFSRYFLSLPQASNKSDVLYLVPIIDTPWPSIYEFNTRLNVTREIPLPFLDGYEVFRTAGCAYVEDGNSILIFGAFVRPDSLRYDLVVKYDIVNDRTELIQMPPIDHWYGHVYLYPSGDNQNVVYMFSSFNAFNTGFYRYDIARNETECFQVSGIKDIPASIFLHTTTLYVKDLNRLYIFRWIRGS